MKAHWLILFIPLAFLGWMAVFAGIALLPSYVAEHSLTPKPDPYHDLLIPSSAWEQEYPKTLTSEQAMADLDVFERIIRRGYVGFDFFAERGLDWDAFFAELRRQFLEEEKGKEDQEEENQQITPYSLAFWLSFSLGTKISDHHLSISDLFVGNTDHWYQTSLVLVEQNDSWLVEYDDVNLIPIGSKLLSCGKIDLHELLQPTLVLVEDELKPRWLLASNDLNKLTTAPCRFRLPSGRIRNYYPHLTQLPYQEKDVPMEPVFSQTVGKVPTITMRSFDDPYYNTAMQQFLPTARRLRDKPAIVLDLRANQGGYLFFVEAWFAGLTSFAIQRLTGRLLDSEVVQQGQINLSVLDGQESIAHGDTAWFDNLDAAFQLLIQEINEFINDGNPFHEVDKNVYEDNSYSYPSHAYKPYQGTLVVLVDNHCASACEWFVHAARQLPNSVIVGGNTEGASLFGDPLVYMLPNSRLEVYVPARLFEQSGNEEIVDRESIGFTPDIWLNGDATETLAQKIAECLIDEKCAPLVRQHIAKARKLLPANKENTQLFGASSR